MTNPSRSQGWTKFRKGSNLDVVLYGTENAWMKEKEFYRVEASLLPSADRVKFSIRVKDARSATKKEITKLQENCEKIIPLDHVRCSIFTEHHTRYHYLQ